LLHREVAAAERAVACTGQHRMGLVVHRCGLPPAVSQEKENRGGNQGQRDGSASRNACNEAGAGR
jgi:hypothetical protein